MSYSTSMSLQWEFERTPSSVIHLFSVAYAITITFSVVSCWRLAKRLPGSSLLLGPVGSLSSLSCLPPLQVRQREDEGVGGLLWRSVHQPGGPERFWPVAVAWSAVRHDGGVLSFHDIRWVVERLPTFNMTCMFMAVFCTLWLSDRSLFLFSRTFTYTFVV